MKVIRLSDGREVCSVDRKVPRDALALAWSRDSARIVIGGSDPGFRSGPNAWLVDANTGQILVTLRDYFFAVRAGRWSPTDDRFALTWATRDSDGRADVIRIHDGTSGNLLAELQGPSTHILHVNWAQADRIRAVASDGDRVEVWEWTLAERAGAQ